MVDEERLNVRLPSTDLVLLKELVVRGLFINEAQAVKSSVRSLIDSILSSDEQIAIIKESESRQSFSLNDFVTDGKDPTEVLGNVIKRGLDSDREEN